MTRFMIASLMMLLSLMLAHSAMAGNIDRIDIGQDEATVQFDDLVVGASVLVLAGPKRIALDIAGAKIGSAGNGGGMVRKVRQGQQNSSTARVVFDLNQPVIVSNAIFATDGRSLTLSLRRVSSAEFARTVARKGWQNIEPPARFRAKPPQKRYSVSVPIGVLGMSGSLPPIDGPRDNRLPLVVIDPGHGGHDPGAISPYNGAHEKDVTLSIARAIRSELLALGRVRVALTRSDDRYLVLEERYGIARQLQADLFISIHADAAPNREARGASVYTLSEVASDREAAKLAARENQANILNGINLGNHSSDVSSILIDLTRRESMNIASDFARLLQRESSENVTFRTDAHRFASFVVLKSPDTPSVLFETGFISNKQDSQFLVSRRGQKQLARGVSKAVQAHFARQIAVR